MGKLEDKYEERKEEYYFEPEKPDLPHVKYYPEKENIIDKGKEAFKRFGFTKNSNTMATAIENKPSPKGGLRKVLSGRPLDLHMLEDYLVWKTSPLEIKTILRYGHSKTIEDMRGYLSSADRAKGNPKMLIMIAIAIILLIGGAVFLLYGPQMGGLLGF